MIKSSSGVKIAILLTSFILFPGYADAAWDCRSVLGAHFKTMWEDSDLSWAAEGMVAHGWFNDQNVTNFLGIAGLDYSFSERQHQFYVEAAYKNLINLAFLTNRVDSLEKHRSGQIHRGIGPREGFYRLNLEKTKFTLGLQTLKLGDFLMLDERVFGANYIQKFGDFSLNASIGNVQIDFARMGEFCGTRRIFNLTRESKAGGRFFQTNLDGVVLTWSPSPQIENPAKTAIKDSSAKEDEFGEFQEFSEFDDKKSEIFKTIGIVYYNEFGNGFYDAKFFYGAMTELQLPLSIAGKLELISQNMDEQRVIIYFLDLYKDFIWQSGDFSTLSLGYIGKYDIDDNAKYLASFGNLYLGEVMRMTSPDIPVFYAALRHEFQWNTKIYVQLKAVQQIEDKHIGEQDLEIGIKFFDHFRLTGIFSRIASEALKEEMYMARFELRAGI